MMSIATVRTLGTRSFASGLFIKIENMYPQAVLYLHEPKQNLM